MDDRTLKALHGSIAKWEGIVAGTTKDEGAENCPLCKLFNVDWGRCIGCPVSAKTGQSQCHGTPYWRRNASHNQDMVDFLKSLLPENPPADTESAGQS